MKKSALTILLKQALRDALGISGVTQSELARRCSSSGTQVVRWLDEERETPIPIFEKAFAALGYRMSFTMIPSPAFTIRPMEEVHV